MSDRTAVGVQASRRLPKDYVPGYSAVLVRSEVKERLARFRSESGLLHESMVERCLVTAAFELLLSDPSLHARWIEQFKEAVNADVRLTIGELRSPMNPATA